jgi:hypothetical protein
VRDNALKVRDQGSDLRLPLPEQFHTRLRDNRPHLVEVPLRLLGEGDRGVECLNLVVLGYVDRNPRQSLLSWQRRLVGGRQLVSTDSDRLLRTGQ